MTEGYIEGRSPRLGARALTTGGGFSGAKMYVAASESVQSALTGYTFGGVKYDTDNYIAAYGSDPGEWVAPTSTVFLIPSDGLYRIDAMLFPGTVTLNQGAGLNPRFILGDGDGNEPDGTLNYWGLVTYWNSSLSKRIGQSSSSNVWVGPLLASQRCVTFFSVFSSLSVATDDKLFNGSWISIERLGDIPA